VVRRRIAPNIKTSLLLAGRPGWSPRPACSCRCPPMTAMARCVLGGPGPGVSCRARAGGRPAVYGSCANRCRRRFRRAPTGCRRWC
jgi:hypothetical protein